MIGMKPAGGAPRVGSAASHVHTSAMDARRDVGVHDRGQLRHHRRRIGDQVDAAAAEGAIGLVVVGERVGVEVLAADQRGVAVQHPELAVLVGVAVVNVGGCVRARVVHRPPGCRDLLHDPALLFADPAGRSAFEQDLHRDPGAGPRSDHLAQARILEGVPLEADAASRPGQQRLAAWQRRCRARGRRPAWRSR